MLKAIIVEDEPRSAEVLRKMIERYCQGVEIGATADTAQGATEQIRALEPDLVFLDIELPDATGFKILEHFPDKSFSIIFITAFEHYAIKAIKASALDYLLKPVDVDELVAAVNKVKTQKAKAEQDLRKEIFVQNSRQKNPYLQKVAIPTMEGLNFINQEEIVMCQADGNYTNLILKSGERIIVSRRLNYFEEILDNSKFCRTHQSYLVNLAHVKSYAKGRGGYLTLTGNVTAEVSSRMKNEFLDNFNK